MLGSTKVRNKSNADSATMARFASLARFDPAGLDDASADSSFLIRRFSLFARFGLVGACTATVIGALVLIGAFSALYLNAYTRQLDSIGRARMHTGEVTTLLTSADGRPLAAQEWPAFSSAVRGALDSAEELVPEQVEQARQAFQSLESSRGDGDVDRSSAQFQSVIEPFTAMSQQLDFLGHSTLRTSTQVRLWTWISIAVVGVIGFLLDCLLLRVVFRSVEIPVRQLGRALRRFGDGDNSVRAQAGDDSVGIAARSFNVVADSVGERLSELTQESERSAQIRQIKDALDLAENEQDVARICERAVAMLQPAVPTELLLMSASSRRLDRVAASPSAGAAGCPVSNPTECQALRRAQVASFSSPEDVGSCPQMQLHDQPCSAVCVPVAAGGRLVGVLHATGPLGEAIPVALREQMSVLAGNVGSRTASLRTIDVHRQAAATDPLTGLRNRRAGEAFAMGLMRSDTAFVLAVVDIDHFKRLNDQFGHEMGDKALRVFANVLKSNVRGNDMVARFGGEEFVLVYPEVSIRRAMEAIERIRSALRDAVRSSGVPAFTCSAGVTASSFGETLDEVIRVADAGLLVAKGAGRDRVVFADRDLARKVFEPTAALAPQPQESASTVPAQRDELPASSSNQQPPEEVQPLAPTGPIILEPPIDLTDSGVSRRGKHARPQPNSI